MNGFRFSIKGLLVAVTLAAIGIYGLVNAAPMWIIIMGSATELVLLAALLAVVCRPSPRRAFCLGFAIFGWAYLLQALLYERGSFFLPTGLFNDWLHEIVSREGPADGFRRIPPKPYFDMFGHYLWTWLLALLGGILARYFYLVQERSAPKPTRHPA